MPPPQTPQMNIPVPKACVKVVYKAVSMKCEPDMHQFRHDKVKTFKNSVVFRVEGGELRGRVR